MNEFKIGEVVVLRSGGRDMTVTGQSPRGSIWCEWSTGDKTINGEVCFYEIAFHPAQLIKTERQ